jgi:pyruvate/2-oxoacid:ferredoxin oxidoreductase alpha subunit
MSASSSPGVSLMQEGLSYSAGSELPMVIININRGGPGLGNIGPEQSDYFQMTKGGGHGNYFAPTLAPNSCQEMCDLTMLAFELADTYRNPACVLADGVIGQMMEPLALPEPRIPTTEPDWAVRGDKETSGNLISSIFLAHEVLEQHIQKLDRKYREIQANEVRYETYQTEDADLVVVAYGVVSRIVYSTVDEARAKGLKVGLLRPITLWPFPTAAIARLTETASMFLAVELSTGQMVEDVRLAVNGKAPVHFYGRCGGMVPGGNELVDEYAKIMEGVATS